MKNFKCLKIYLLGVIFMILQACTTTKTNSIVHSKTLEDIVMLTQKHLKTVNPEDILAIFDINYTLTCSQHPAMQMSLIKKGLYQITR